MPSALFRRILSCFREESYGPGDIIVRAGKASRLCLCIDGHVRISILNDNGTFKETRSIRPGQYFGEGILLPVGAERRPALLTALAVDADTKCLTLDQSQYDRAIVQCSFDSIIDRDSPSSWGEILATAGTDTERQCIGMRRCKKATAARLLQTWKRYCKEIPESSTEASDILTDPRVIDFLGGYKYVARIMTLSQTCCDSVVSSMCENQIRSIECALISSSQNSRLDLINRFLTLVCLKIVQEGGDTTFLSNSEKRLCKKLIVEEFPHHHGEILHMVTDRFLFGMENAEGGSPYQFFSTLHRLVCERSIRGLLKICPIDKCEIPMCMKLASVDASQKVHVVVFTRVSEDNGRTEHDHAVQKTKCREIVQSWYRQHHPSRNPEDLVIIHIGEDEQTGYHADKDVWDVENVLLTGEISAFALVNEERIGRAPAVASAMLACVSEGAKAGTSPGPVHLLCHSLSSSPQGSIGPRILDKVTVSLYNKRIKQKSNHNALIDRQSRSFRIPTSAEDIFSFDDSGIATPLPSDYLPTEKGYDPSSNPGNQMFDKICSENFDRHKNASTAERGRINMEIILAFKATGGRILKRDNQTGLFYEVDVSIAKNKVSSWMTTRREKEKKKSRKSAGGSKTTKKSTKSTGGSKTTKKSTKSTGGSKTTKTGNSAKSGSNVSESSTRPRRRKAKKGEAANDDTVQPRETDTKRAAARSRRSATKKKQKSRNNLSSDSECNSECEELGGVDAPTTTKAGRRQKASKASRNIQLSVEDDDEESDYVDE